MAKTAEHLLNVSKNHVDLGMGDLMKPDADWSGFAHFQLDRIQKINALGGPRMHLVHWLSIEQLGGRLPRWPDDVGSVLDAEELLKTIIAKMDCKGKIDGLVPCISMFSHRWERPDMDPAKAHADSTDHKKARALMHYGKRGTCPIFDPHHKFDYYFWVDFAGIHQTCLREKYLGIAKLPALTAACTEVIFYWSATASYEPRAWTRLERLLGFNFAYSPLFVFINDDYPHKDLDVAKVIASAPTVFMPDPDTPNGMCMLIKDPLGADAAVTDDWDMPLIEKLMNACLSAPPINPAAKMAGLDKFGTVKFGKTFQKVNTEHFRIDANAARLEAQRSSIGGV